MARLGLEATNPWGAVKITLGAPVKGLVSREMSSDFQANVSRHGSAASKLTQSYC